MQDSTVPTESQIPSKRRTTTQAKFVLSAEREDCVLDRAWEARPERRVRDRVACRLCFRQVSRLTGKTAHLSIWHDGMTGEEYARLMPEHRHDCFQHSADANGLEVEELMDDWCIKWATADEIRNWRLEPKLAQVDEYVGCLECGRKIFGEGEIQRHLGKIHKWDLGQYREAYPGAPTGSLKRRAMQTKKSIKRFQELKHLRALAAQGALPKPKGGSKGGRPKGMMRDTRQEAQQLELLMQEFEKLYGTRRGALQYACKKVYPRSLDPLKAVRRGSKTLAKYRKQRKNKTPQ